MDEEIKKMCTRLGLDPVIFEVDADVTTIEGMMNSGAWPPRKAPRNTSFPQERVSYRTASGGWADRPATEEDYKRRRGIKEALTNGR